MNEFVSKVAQAIWLTPHDGTGILKARAAIAAMEPTPEMVEAGKAASMPYSEQGYDGLEAWNDEENIKEMWNAMRAVALKET